MCVCLCVEMCVCVAMCLGKLVSFVSFCVCVNGCVIFCVFVFACVSLRLCVMCPGCSPWSERKSGVSVLFQRRKGLMSIHLCLRTGSWCLISFYTLQELYDTHNIAGSVFNSPKLNFFIFVRTDSYQMVVLMCIAP